ncbi:MAG: DNA mismatch repair protein MutS [Clostridia bacterium]|nr:DNA mismatch repair protein MutS [Clostridia bacterium]
MAENEGLSPMMQNYMAKKEEYKDCILFYRLGDFYEMFFDDAILASRELEITLTGRNCGLEERAPMCGVPFHSAEIYISKLIAKGYKVAICEQLEDPKTTKGMVKRDVIRVVTPGTVIENNMLEEKKNNFIMSIVKKGFFYGVAVCDVSTGDFYATQITENNNFSKLLDEIARYMPAEIITNSMMINSDSEISQIKDRINVCISEIQEDKFSEETDLISNMYTIINENGDKIEEFKDKLFAIAAINGLNSYLTDTQKIKLEHINRIKIYKTTRYMALDINARRNLELTERLRDKSKRGTLLWVLDKTLTSMGGRALRRWISDPLIEIKEINDRLNSVKELKENLFLRGEISEILTKVYDIERLAGRISYGNANARDMISLKNSISKLPELKKLLKDANSDMLKNLYENLDELIDITELIEKSIVDEPPISIKEGGIIKTGYDQQVDEYRKASVEGKSWLVNIETKEREATGIKNLKVGYTKVFGYYIEVTKSFLSQVPDRFIRKQTLTGCERYITEELKEIEDKVLGAEEKVVDLEYKIFTEIRSKISSQIERIQNASNIVSSLDVLTAFATVAEDYDYCMPEVNNGDEIIIKEGRHPVVERMIDDGFFVQNDTYLNGSSDRLSIITGPNMAGKSTYMRQVALITLMAQIGCFVPAVEAKIGIVDKIFTRVGASDDLSMGQSTFMVEMMEVANILKEATRNSLVILDEIGRGTSTYDGLAIAWSVAEYIADKEKIGCKTLFATHYHELTSLEEKIDGIKNYQIAVKEKGEDVIFLRKIIPGGTDESYGIHVAKLAGAPRKMISRANEILRTLEKKVKVKEKEDRKQVVGQLDMYNYKLADVASEIDKINVNELTPIDALNIIVRIKEKLN